MDGPVLCNAAGLTDVAYKGRRRVLPLPYDMSTFFVHDASDLPAYLTRIYLYNYLSRQTNVLAVSILIGVHSHLVHLVPPCTSPHRERKSGRLASA